MDSVTGVPVTTNVRIWHVGGVVLVHVVLGWVVGTVWSMERNLHKEGFGLVIGLEKLDGRTTNVCCRVVVLVQNVSSSSVVIVLQASCHGVYSRVSLGKPLVIVVQFFRESIVEICLIVSMGHPFVCSFIPTKVVLTNRTGEVTARGEGSGQLVRIPENLTSWISCIQRVYGCTNCTLWPRRHSQASRDTRERDP